jgi:hypothetical protein
MKLTPRQAELKDIIKDAKYNEKLARRRLHRAQIKGNEIKCDQEYKYLGYWNEVVINTSDDLYYSNGEMKEI